MSADVTPEQRCYVCQQPTDAQCPLCKRYVCQRCAEGEGECCCDVEKPPECSCAPQGGGEHEERCAYRQWRLARIRRIAQETMSGATERRLRDELPCRGA